jgi:hypothetical protein
MNAPSFIYFWAKVVIGICRYEKYRVISMDYSISLNGVFAAQQAMEQAARRVATPQPATDYAEEMLAVNQAKIAHKANLRVLSAEMDLQEYILDLFA